MLIFSGLQLYSESEKLSPDTEKTHKIENNDTLADISFQYYNKDERSRGAHWIHIYEYSVQKGLINPKTQPILPFGKNGALVRIFVNNKLLIPFYEGEYPSANDLLGKYGFEISLNGVNVAKMDNNKKTDKINVDDKDNNGELEETVSIPKEELEEVEDIKVEEEISNNININIEEIENKIKTAEKNEETDTTSEAINEKTKVNDAEDTSINDISKIDDNNSTSSNNSDSEINPDNNTVIVDITEENKEETENKEIYTGLPINIGIDEAYDADNNTDGSNPFWVGTYKIDEDEAEKFLKSELEKIGMEYSDEMDETLSSLSKEFRFTLNDNNTYTMTMNGDTETGSIKSATDGYLELKGKSGEVMKIKPTKKDGKIIFNYKTDEMEILLYKINVK